MRSKQKIAAGLNPGRESIEFTRKLLKWNRDENDRHMPWKNETDPYRIWLSEIILQQTRVRQGWSYYENFIRHFPTIQDLARAPEKKVFKLWEGLGYYSRCRNLIQTAKKIVKDYNGKFPSTYEGIAELKGIGPYTAAAIASFAFNLPYPVVDGNVQRILARYFGITTPVDSAAGKKIYQQLANSLLPGKKPGIYNQAIMDFGAVICKPKNPLCHNCVQATGCMSFRYGWVSLLPLSKKKPGNKKRWFYYFLIETGKDQIYLRKRIQKDIWENLYEPVLLEMEQESVMDNASLASLIPALIGKQSYSILSVSKPRRQVLTHQTIQAQFISIRIRKPSPKLSDYILVQKKDIPTYPFPGIIAKFLLSESK